MMRLNASELTRNMIAEIIAIQCILLNALRTTLPARCVLGKTENAVGARTKAKKIRPPIQATSDSSIRKRRKDMQQIIVTSSLNRWSHGHRNPLDNLSQDFIRLFRFLFRRGVMAVDGYAVGEDWHR